MEVAAPAAANLRASPCGAAYLLKRDGRDADALFDLLERGVIRIGLAMQEGHADIRALMHRYRNRPMSFADACLVRLSEIHATGEVFTLDSDFPTAAMGTKSSRCGCLSERRGWSGQFEKVVRGRSLRS
jgi:hypothetical protein